MRVYYKIGACSVLYSMLLIKQKVQGGKNREPNQKNQRAFPMCCTLHTCGGGIAERERKQYNDERGER